MLNCLAQIQLICKMGKLVNILPNASFTNFGLNSQYPATHSIEQTSQTESHNLLTPPPWNGMKFQLNGPQPHYLMLLELLVQLCKIFLRIILTRVIETSFKKLVHLFTTVLSGFTYKTHFSFISNEKPQSNPILAACKLQVANKR